LAQKGPA